MASASSSPSTTLEFLSTLRRNNNFNIYPETLQRIKDPKEALSGQQLLDFIHKNTPKKPVILIIPDLDTVPFPVPNRPYILNLTEDVNKGTHWCVIFNKNGHLYMFDSYKVSLNILPPRWKRVVRRWNECGFQNPKTVVCGHYTALAVCYPYLFKGKNSFTKCSNINLKMINSTSTLKNDANVYVLYDKLTK